MRDAPEPGRLEQPREAPSPLRFGGFILDLYAITLVRETGEAVALTRASSRSCAFSSLGRVESSAGMPYWPP
jgi:hypothetical protein